MKMLNRNHRAIYKIKGIHFIGILFVSFFGCSRSDTEFVRCVGFRVDQNSTTQIVERIQYKEEKYFFSPEGKKVFSKYKRSRYELVSGDKSTHMSFLNQEYPCVFIPFDNSKLWIAVRFEKTHNFKLEYNPDPEKPVEIMIFKPLDGILKKIKIETESPLFPRGSQTLWYFDKKNNEVKKLSVDGNGKLKIETSKTNERDKYTKAINIERDFLSSTSFFNLDDVINSENQIEHEQEMRSGRIWYSGEEGHILLDKTSPQIGKEVSRFLFFEKSNSKKCSNEIDTQIILPFLITKDQNRIWYLESISNRFGETNSLKSVPLGECM
ncbi:hypothetical protein SCOR_10080 [Sulfidibacter corallicola]|uniref:Lipoprotein n=1 Tax=Sulfidibacter corallicola TaxID=2818388 RepID=A0A8A4TFJ8_SULCO|nr:hypothetical protein [Sulfidibacter corallicola]QTD48307.1 hypothetical protein J3U87_22235 [Sulfidibacter corallicola]